MLEEGLRSAAFSPAEAGQGLLSFVRFELQDGGANAEKRFIGLFSLVCERLYGSIDPKDFRHQTGGWLARQSRWEIPRTPSNSTQRTMSHHAHLPSQAPSIDADPVVQLLCGMENLKSKERLPTFIEAISGNTEARRGVRIQYPFYALPKPTQDFVLKMLQSCLDGSIVDESMRSNAFRLFGGLLRVPPRDQTEIRRVQANMKSSKVEHLRSRPLALSPGGVSPLLLSTNSSRMPIDDKKKTPATPQIMLNMVEYFLFTFFRYALATPPATTPAPQGHHRGQGGITRHRVTPYGETVYLHLFRCYLMHYLPAHEQRKTFLGFPKLSTENELFLRILIELWLCNGMELIPVKKSAEALLERRKKNGNTCETVDLESAFDLVKVKYEAPPATVQKCLKSLVAHIIKDPNVAPAIMDCSDVAKKKADGIALPWCISPSMTVMQQDFYNYVVVSFRNAPIHVTGSPFYSALESWLLWLEPWNVEIRKKHADFASTVSNMSHATQKPQPTIHVLRTMKPTARSNYTKAWEPFIAANLHLYTVPLALFLRRARELDFSSQYFTRSFALLQRVFRIYTPEVMFSIHNLLAGQHSMDCLVETHVKNLGAYAPLGPTHMSSLQTDMQNLLEEVDMQYRKTVRERGFLDRFEANIEGIFSFIGLVPNSPGEERQIQQLVEKAKLVTGLPADYQIAASGDGGGGGSIRSRSPSGVGEQSIKVNGVLTDYGKEQLISGEVTCSPDDVLYVGERMSSSPKSHELAWLVPLTIRGSDYLNSRLGLEKSVRINIRFLADYRNLLFLVLVLWLWIRFLL